MINVSLNPFAASLSPRLQSWNSSHGPKVSPAGRVANYIHWTKRWNSSGLQSGSTIFRTIPFLIGSAQAVRKYSELAMSRACGMY